MSKNLEFIILSNQGNITEVLLKNQYNILVLYDLDVIWTHGDSRTEIAVPLLLWGGQHVFRFFGSSGGTSTKV